MLASLVFRPFEIRDADVFWHLATGKWILLNHVIPRSDPFSHTATGSAWIDHEWLIQILARLVQLASGINGLYLIKCMLYSAAIALPSVVVLSRRKCSGPALAASAIALGCSFAFSEYRPIAASLVLFAAMIELAHLHPEKRWAAPSLVALFVFWANIHATFVLGLAVLLVLTLSPRMPRNSGVILFLACATATLLNPYGWRIYEVPLSVGSSRLFMAANQEWRPPDLSLDFLPFYLSIVLVVAAFLSAVTRDLSARLVISLLLMALCLRSRRIIPFFSVALVPVFAEACASIPQTLKRRILYVGSSLPLIFALAVEWRLVTNLGPITRTADGLPFRYSAFPEQCANRLPEIASQGRLFNDYNHGGFLHYVVGPEWKVYIDGRNDLFGERATLAYNELALGKPGSADTITSACDAVLLSYDMVMHRPNLAQALAKDPRWRFADFDDAAILFVRSTAGIAEPLCHVRPWLLYEEQAPQAGTTAMEEFVAELKSRVARGRCRIAEQMLAQALAANGERDAARQVLDLCDGYFGADLMSEAIRDTLNGPR